MEIIRIAKRGDDQTVIRNQTVTCWRWSRSGRFVKTSLYGVPNDYDLSFTPSDIQALEGILERLKEMEK